MANLVFVGASGGVGTCSLPAGADLTTDYVIAVAATTFDGDPDHIITAPSGWSSQLAAVSGCFQFGPNPPAFAVRVDKAVSATGTSWTWGTTGGLPAPQVAIGAWRNVKFRQGGCESFSYVDPLSELIVDCGGWEFFSGFAQTVYVCENRISSTEGNTRIIQGSGPSVAIADATWLATLGPVQNQDAFTSVPGIWDAYTVLLGGDEVVPASGWFVGNNSVEDALPA